MRAPQFVCLAIFELLTVVQAGAMHRRQNPIDSCTQTDWNELDLCLDSALSVFSVTYQNGDTSIFDYASIGSQINSIQSGLTSFGITMTSFLPDPSVFASTAQPGSLYSGPYVSDIVSSYSEYTATRTDSSGSLFSYETSGFTREPTSTATITSSASFTPISSVTSTSSNLGQAALTTSSAGRTSGTKDTNTVLAALVMVLLSITTF